MTIATTSRMLIAAGLATGVLASSALAAGEPKNTPPFMNTSGASHWAAILSGRDAGFVGRRTGK